MSTDWSIMVHSVLEKDYYKDSFVNYKPIEIGSLLTEKIYWEIDRSKYQISNVEVISYNSIVVFFLNNVFILIVFF